MTVPFALLLAVQVGQSGVSGTVRDELTGAPLEHAIIALPDLDHHVLTDEEGRFLVAELPPGPHHISIARHGFGTRTLHALVPRSGLVELNVALQPVPLELDGLVVEPRLAIRGAEDVGTMSTADAVSLAAVRNHPMIAEADVFRVLEGGDVAVLPESHSGLHIRGGAASHTAFELDGIPVLGPIHAAGLFSAWNPDALSSVGLSTSTAGALSSLSGTVVGVTRTAGSAPRGSSVLSTTQARLALDGPLGSEGGGYVLSWRAGFPSSVVRPTDPAKIRGEAGDILTKVELPFLGGNVTLLGYGSENELNAGAVPDLPSGTPAGGRNGFEWKTQALGAAWEHESSLGRVEVRAWDSQGSASARLIAADGAEHGVDNHRTERGFVATLVRADGRGRELSIGARVNRGATRYAFDSDAPFESRGGLTTGSLLLGYEAPLVGQSGLRADLDLTGSALGLRVSPVLTAYAALGRAVTVSGTVSRRHQFAQSLRNEESLLGTVFPTDLFVSAGSGGVPIALADEASFRVEYRPLAGLTVGGQGYVRNLESIVFVAPSTGTLFSSGEYDVGKADIEGVSLDAALSGSRYGLVFDYAAQRTQHTVASGSYVPSYAPAQRAQAGVVFHATPTMSLRVSHSGIWGRRATALVGAVEWESCNLLDGGCELAGAPPHGDALGEIDPGSYQRTDFGIRKHWHVGVASRDSMLAVYGTLTNILSRINILNFSRDPVTGQVAPIDMLPLTPLVLGLELTF